MDNSCRTTWPICRGRDSRLAALGILLMTLAPPSSPLFAAEPTVETYVYKKAGELDIQAKVWQYADSRSRPGVVWIHGGALINGHRDGVSQRVQKFARENEFVLISIDYRLAPETKLPAIIEDIEDAFRWMRRDGPRLFHVDPQRIAVTGGSAGGCLTLVSGFRVRPAPQVLLSFWGYGDLIGPWYSQPSPHPRHHRSKLGRAEAWNQVSGPPISDSRDRRGDGGAFYQFCRQRGEWPKAVTGWDPVAEAKRFYPYMAVKNVTPKYPPTILIHGDADTDVPHEQSVMMAEQFRRHGVEHKLFSIAGGEHGLAGGDPRQIEQAYRQAFELVKSKLRQAPAPSKADRHSR